MLRHLCTSLIAYLYYTGIPTAIVAQMITSSDLQNGESVCPDEGITLNCTTVNSAGLAWRSQEYVGDQLLLASSNEEGYSDSSTSVSGTVATLTEKYIENGMQVLESALHFVPSTEHPTATVTCVHTDSRNEDLLVVQVLGKYFSFTVILCSICHVLLEEGFLLKTFR